MATWEVSHTPAANVQATITQAAAGAGIRNICNHIIVSAQDTAAPGASVTLTWVIRDGLTGVGPIIDTGILSSFNGSVFLTGLLEAGSPNTAMTIEFTAAGGATVTEAVHMGGFTF